jgi:hypothetical protein
MTMRFMNSIGKVASTNSITNPTIEEMNCLLKMEKALLLARSESTNEAESTMSKPTPTMKITSPISR